ncbi:MAG TPA: thioesterase family protein, partial [Bacteroidota bacterium]|nr:thioesterase family protein [Bacteroidota bacterium]
FVRTAHVDYRRALGMGEKFTVRTWVDEFFSDGVKVQFQIVKKLNGKISCDGWFNFIMINLKTGKAEEIPKWILKKYEI